MASSISNQGALAEREVLDRATCKHNWVIDAPAGPSSRGVCCLCGEERQFQNFIEGSYWANDVSLEQLSGGSRIPTPIGASKVLDMEQEE